MSTLFVGILIGVVITTIIEIAAGCILKAKVSNMLRRQEDLDKMEESEYDRLVKEERWNGGGLGSNDARTVSYLREVREC